MLAKAREISWCYEQGLLSSSCGSSSRIYRWRLDMASLSHPKPTNHSFFCLSNISSLYKKKKDPVQPLYNNKKTELLRPLAAAAVDGGG